MSGPPAFVTGASGFLGRKLVAALAAAGREVFVLGHRRPLGAPQPGITVVEGALEDPAAWRPALAAGCTVFHLAAVRAAPGVRRAELLRINSEAAGALAAAALAARAGRFVLVSTAWTHGSSGAAGRPRSEEDPPEALALASAYVASKVEGARRIAEAAARGLPAVTVSPGIVFGLPLPGSANRLAAHARRVLASRLAPTIGAGRRLRSVVCGDDVVAGLLAAERAGEPGREYVLVGGDLSHRGFDRAVLAAAGRRGIAPRVPAGAVRRAARVVDGLAGYDRGSGYRAAVEALDAEWRFDGARAARELGFRPTPLAESIGRMVRGLLAADGEAPA